MEGTEQNATDLTGEIYHESFEKKNVKDNL